MMVTAVSQGTATITATSESAPSATTPLITVNPVPVATVTLSFPVTQMVAGGTQVLTAVPKDAGFNILSGRTVNWISSNPSVLSVSASSSVSTSSGATVTVTGLSQGTATITATSETAPSAMTPTITVSPATAAGPLRVSTVNPRYFADPSGRVVYLTGSHYWKNVQDNSTTNPPAAFDNDAYLDFLQAHNHNFTRLWVWEQSRWTTETSVSNWFSPTLYVRTGPGTGADGGSKFDLNQINPAYLARLRQRVIDAGARGIYVSVMLFDGWSVGMKGGSTASNPWLGHPFNSANNINSINGDTNGDLNGMEIQTLSNSAITARQDTYVRAVIDAVNDLDNVIYEISNESDPSGDAWQYHMINLVRSYEATKSKQHPIGMTVPYPNASNSEVLSSPADWVSMNGDINNLAVANGSKVSLSDTDHLCGICATAAWPWMSLMRGHNTLFMDGYDGSAGVGDPDYDPNNSLWPIVRNYMGYARSYALRMDLVHALPSGSLASSGDCLAVAGSEYLVLLPTGGSVTLNLNGVSGSFTVEWFSPRSNSTVIGSSVPGGSTVTLTAPGSFGAGNLAVVYVHR
jgi:hypothetical protein